MIKSALFLILPFLISIAFAQDSGTIDLEIKNWEGDLIDPFGTKILVYQNNKLIQEIELESNPQKISNLELGDKYSFNIIRHGIIIPANKYVDLNSDSKLIGVSIPSDGGIKLNVLYKNGYTPVVGATVSIKSTDGMPLVSTHTNTQGQTERFWFQSTVDDQFYFAEVALADGLSFIYSPIKISSGIASDYKIVTPWPQIIDDLITVEIFKDGKKISKDDGTFKVMIYDKNDQKISESQVTRGEAHFSNIPIGKYTLKVLKKTDEGSFQNWNTFMTILDGKRDTIQISESFLDSKKGCNCVAFRLDDVQDYFLNEIQKEVIELFRAKDSTLTIGVIGGLIGTDQGLVDTIKENLRIGTLEIASHSWNNVPITTYSKSEQSSIIKMTNDKIYEEFGILPTVFIPPENIFNEDTLLVLQENGFTYMSSSFVNDSPPYPLQNSEFYRFPQGAQTARLDSKTNQWISESKEKIIDDVKSSLNNYGYAVVMMHPPDFSVNDHGLYRNEVNQIKLNDLSTLIDDIKKDGLKIVPINQINLNSKDKPTFQEKKTNCNCVAFTLAGIQDFWLNDVQLEILKTFDEEDIKYTAGIIANHFGEDTKLLDYFKTKLAAMPKIDIANNGWNYEYFPELSSQVQSSLISEANKKIEDLLQVKPITFIPPQDGINESLINELEKYSMKIVSSSVSTSPLPYTFDDNSVNIVPYSISTSIFNSEMQKFNFLSSDELFSLVADNVNQNGFTVIRLTVQEFAQENNGEFQNKLNLHRILELKSLIQKIKQNDYNIVLITEIPKLASSGISYIPEWIKNNAKWWAQDAISDSEFIAGIEFMVQNGIIKIPASASVDSEGSTIPEWIKNNAKWWAQDAISDSEFIAGIEFMVKAGIIKV